MQEEGSAFNGDGGDGAAAAAAAASAAANAAAAVVNGIQSTDKTLVELALEVLHEGDPFRKAELTARAAALWDAGAVAAVAPAAEADRAALAARVPARPARDDAAVRVVDAKAAPKLRGREAMLHNLVHVESWWAGPSAGGVRGRAVWDSWCLELHERPARQGRGATAQSKTNH